MNTVLVSPGPAPSRRAGDDAALRTKVSTRHLSFIEISRSTPSREMTLYLAELVIESFFPADADIAAVLREHDQHGI